MGKIAVISGKGGSGKSTVAAAFVSLSERVVAVDCDVDASNLPLLFPHEVRESEAFVSGVSLEIDASKCTGCGICVEACAFGALKIGDSGLAEADEFSCEACGLCVRRCPVSAISLREVAGSRIYTGVFPKGVLVYGELRPGDDNSGKMIARLREIADARMAETGIGLQLLDGPPGIGCPVLSTLTGVDRVVLVCEPTVSGLSDFRRAFKVAASFCKDIFVILNKSDMNAAHSALITDFCREHALPLLACLPFDRRMVEAQLHCRSITDYAPDSVCARELRKAWSRLTA